MKFPLIHLYPDFFDFCRKALISLAILLFFGQKPALSADLSNAWERTSILFLGSSYFNNNDMPGLVRNLAVWSGYGPFIDQYIPSGMSLAEHASSRTTADKIREKKWDYVVLHGSPVGVAYPDSFPSYAVYPPLVSLQNKILSNSPATKIIYSMPWAFEDGMVWRDGWTDTYKDMQRKINQNTLPLVNDPGVIIAPVGLAWYKVLEEKGYPLHYLHRADWVHPTLQGSYLAACVIYSAIYMERSKDNTYGAGLDGEEARYFQRIADETVFDDLGKWNIQEYTGIRDHGDSDMGIRLDQNYPNPFHSQTNITFTLNKSGYVEISLFDPAGRSCLHVLNEFKTPGRYSIIVDGSSLPAGIYFYRMKTGSGTIIRKMMVGQ